MSIMDTPIPDTHDTFQTAYDALNEQQRRAVDTIEGPVLVVAGPGSGKTQILSMRVGNILRETDALPSNILCLTFTESAAVNMRERLTDLIGRDAYRIAIHTFHNFGVDIIERHPEYFYNNAEFTPADELVQIEVITTLLDRATYDDPLKKQHPEQGYTYVHPIRTAISQLKKAGLTPHEFRQALDADAHALEKHVNPWITELFTQRLSKGVVDTIEHAISDLRGKAEAVTFPVPTFVPLERAVADSLEYAMQDAADREETKPISAWKQRWTVADADQGRVLKDTYSLERLYALADMYEAYMDEMYRRGYYDFDDMLLQTIQAVEQNAVLRAELQEQFRYVLVDEFQDTNDAQMRLLHTILDSPINEGRPNIMAVGDDDQAIYKFQGAEVSNILNFRSTYTDPAVITLTENYRSSQDILDIARFVIGKGEERLEQRIPEIEKELVASNPNIGNADIEHATLPTRSHEYSWVARQIRHRLDSGDTPSSIAVIARQHKHLQELLPYLYAENVPVRYERQQNVLHEPHVFQLIQMARFISSLSRKQRDEADDLLPEILSYPFWGLDRITVWRISVDAARENALWLDVMQQHEDQYVRDIAQFFIDLSVRSLHEPLEFVLDYLVGSHIPLKQEADDELLSEEGSNKGESYGSDHFTSPFREYYFSKEQFDQNTERYVTFLSSLRVFMESIRGYKQGETIGVDDLVAFVDLHEQNNIPVIDTSPYVSADEAVQLLTVHKAKGLEFDSVFVLSCIDGVWTPKARGSSLPFPMNLPIMPAGDTLDDQLRLFYVALTRARHRLYLSAYHAGDTDGKEQMPVQFLAEEAEERSALPAAVQQVIAKRGSIETQAEIPDTTDVLAASFATAHAGPFAHEEAALLRSLVEDYQMSVTHLNNFLNVAKGGPQFFLEQNLLRFPQAKTAAGSFGTAIHKALELLITYIRKHTNAPSKEKVIEWFENALRRERLGHQEYEIYRKRGADALMAYYDEQIDTFDPSQLGELNFRTQGVVIGDAALTGKIDRFIPTGQKEAEVHDYKTGRAKDSWKGASPYEQIQLHQFKQQLIVYKILVEESRDWGGYVVNRGVLEFVEPKHGNIVSLSYDITKEDVEHTKELIKAVYDRIVSLDFPDVSLYTADLSGVRQFEHDLVEEYRSREGG